MVHFHSGVILDFIEVRTAEPSSDDEFAILFFKQFDNTLRLWRMSGVERDWTDASVEKGIEKLKREECRFARTLFVSESEMIVNEVL
jgi:hypothetical protein